jgi:hypothetical protein
MCCEHERTLRHALAVRFNGLILTAVELGASFLAESTCPTLASTAPGRYGQAMFRVLPQWHLLRFAEDFALADVMTASRMLFGIGRGTVPHEVELLGSSVGWNNDPDACAWARIAGRC